MAFEKIRAPIYGGLTQTVDSPVQTSVVHDRHCALDRPSRLPGVQRRPDDRLHGLALEAAVAGGVSGRRSGLVQPVARSRRLRAGEPVPATALKTPDPKLTALVSRYQQVEAAIERPDSGPGGSGRYGPERDGYCRVGIIARRAMRFHAGFWKCWKGQNGDARQPSSQGSGRLELARKSSILA